MTTKTVTSKISTDSKAKTVQRIYKAPPPHWVGDGFHVRSLFAYDGLGQEEASPFLLLDYGAPKEFAPSNRQHGVGEHPHRGFETVTIAYQGEVAHRDSTGQGGVIGPGDVQWMTAAAGILHEEFHSPDFARRGGIMEMAQLWVNLPKKDKMAKPGYQGIVKGDIPVVPLGDDAGSVRVIAGEYQGQRGPARTFTPIDLWDVSLKQGAHVALDLPEGHTLMLVARRGRMVINGTEQAGPTELALLTREGSAVALSAPDEDAEILLMSGEPIDEPVVGYGPFVMTSMEEIRQAVMDFQAGKFGRM